MLSRPLVKYILTAAVRDRLMIVSLLVVVVGAAIATFLGSSAIVEANRFALVFTAGGLRFAGMAGLVLFIVFYMRRAFETREVEFLLSRPISRVTFIFSHAVAFSLLAVLVAGLVTLTVYISGPEQAAPGIVLWGTSIVAEFIIMANAALFFSLVLTSPSGSAMATFGLYVLGRLMGEILGIVRRGEYLPGKHNHELAIVMKLISPIMPRLDLLGQSSWLIYGTADSMVSYNFILGQGLLFSALLLLAALIDLVRRQF